MSNEVQISLKNVNKSFGAHHVLNDVNIDINKGDFICIFGKSGGGKTTLLNILGTLETYDNGEMRSFEKLDPIKKKKECELLRRNNIAYLFQNFALVEKMTVEDNMKLAVKYNKAKNKKELIQTALDKMGVGDKLKSKVYELSGGEQQRVAIKKIASKSYLISEGKLEGLNEA